MFSFIRFKVFLLCAGFLLLSACGGGGGGSTVMAPMTPAPQPRPPAQPAPLPTSAGLRAMLHAIQQQADSVVATDSVVAPGGRLQYVCDFTQCTNTVNGVPLTITATDAPIYLHPVDAPQYDNIFRTPQGIVMAGIDSADLSAYGLGGWLNFSHFTTVVNEIRDPARPGAIAGIGLQAYSLGDATGTTPVSGSAVWEGRMVGAYNPDDHVGVGANVVGEARMTFDFANTDLDLALTNVQSRRRSHANMYWQNVPVRQGRFGVGGDTNSLQGQFYGPNHEEAGGVFERNQIIGAFGAIRQ